LFAVSTKCGDAVKSIEPAVLLFRKMMIDDRFSLDNKAPAVIAV